MKDREGEIRDREYEMRDGEGNMRERKGKMSHLISFHQYKFKSNYVNYMQHE